MSLQSKCFEKVVKSFEKLQGIFWDSLVVNQAWSLSIAQLLIADGTRQMDTHISERKLLIADCSIAQLLMELDRGILNCSIAQLLDCWLLMELDRWILNCSIADCWWNWTAGYSIAQLLNCSIAQLHQPDEYSHLWEKSPHLADWLAEHPRILMPIERQVKCCAWILFDLFNLLA